MGSWLNKRWIRENVQRKCFVIVWVLNTAPSSACPLKHRISLCNRGASSAILRNILDGGRRRGGRRRNTRLRRGRAETRGRSHFAPLRKVATCRHLIRASTPTQPSISTSSLQPRAVGCWGSGILFNIISDFFAPFDLRFLCAASKQPTFGSASARVISPTPPTTGLSQEHATSPSSSTLRSPNTPRFNNLRFLMKTHQHSRPPLTVQMIHRQLGGAPSWFVM